VPVAFDTLAYAKRLRGAGLSEEQASVYAEALAIALGEVLVTKQDLRELATKEDLHRLELATTAEFAVVRQEMTTRFGAVDGELGSVRHDTASEFAAVRKEMAAGFAALRQEMAAGLGELRQEMTAGLGELRQEMTAGFAAVDREFAAVRQEMRALETRMTLRLGALLSIGIGALAALSRL
jgi:hypothetical protein